MGYITYNCSHTQKSLKKYPKKIRFSTLFPRSPFLRSPFAILHSAFCILLSAFLRFYLYVKNNMVNLLILPEQTNFLV